MLNIKKLFTKLIPTIGPKYIKFCGVGIAWGYFTSTGAWASTQQYGITFASTPTVIYSKAENVSTPSNVTTVVTTNLSQFSMNFSSPANTKEINWLAIGKV